MRCEFGYCIICDKEIAKRCDACSTRKPTNDYTEVHLNLSNGSIMPMAVCTACAPEKIWKADKKEMIESVWKAWDKMGHPYNKEVLIV